MFGLAYRGGVKLETMPPDVTEAPTTSPTSPYTPGTITSEIPSTGINTDSFNGLQFDVDNMGDTDIIVNKLSVLFSTTGTHHIEVWHRDGSHKGSTGACENWNNWCGQWSKVAEGNVYVSSVR